MDSQKIDKEILIKNIDRIYSTELGILRIKKNLNLDDNAIEYCKKKILNKDTNIYKKGKNYYCEIDNIIITINSYTYTIITVHYIKKNI